MLWGIRTDYLDAELAKQADLDYVNSKNSRKDTMVTEAIVKMGDIQHKFFSDALKTNTAQCAAASGKVNRALAENLYAAFAQKADKQFYQPYDTSNRAGSTGRPVGAPSDFPRPALSQRPRAGSLNAPLQRS